MSELLAEEEVLKIVRDGIYRDEDIRVLDHSIRAREKFGYLGDHLTLAVRILLDERQITHSFFIKTYKVPPSNELDFIGETGMFTKEVLIYKEIFTQFRAHFRGPQFSPKFYFSKDRVLVLEDLSVKKFEMKKDNYLLNKEHLELVLKAVSTLHACTIIFEHKQNSPLDKTYPDAFNEFLYDENKTHLPSFMWKERQTQDLTTAVDFLNKYSLEQKNMIKKYIPVVIDKIYPLSKKSDRWQNVLVHGDMWNNNLLFQYKEGKPVDCRLVDYQFSRYAPPMHDIMHLLHLTTDKAFRETNEDGLIMIYYKALKENLSLHGVDINHFYPWELFMESKNAYKLLALIQSLLSMHYLLGGRKTQEDPKLRGWNQQEKNEYLSRNRQETIKNCFADTAYTTTVGGILCEIIDDYILNENQRTRMNIT